VPTISEALNATAVRTSAAPEDFDARVHEAQIRLLYEQLPVSIAASMVGTLLFAAIFWSDPFKQMLVAWTLVMMLNQSWRLLLYRRFRARDGFPRGEVRRYGMYWAIGSGISGMVWGAASLLFFAVSPVMQTMLIVSVFAVTSAAVLLIGSHLPSFYAFVLPALVPIVARNVAEGEPLHLLLALITAIATLGILAFGRNYNSALVQSLRNRFENEALARTLVERNHALEAARATAEVARAQAEVANRSKTQFFAAASHDLRQPLHALGLFAAALAEKVHDPDVMNVVHSINSSVSALDSLFNELLDISRIDAGVIKVNRRHFPLEPILVRLRTDFAPEADEKMLRLTIRPTALHLDSDPVIIERILRNLVSNALRYTREGGVLMAARARGETVALEVWDTGIGIPAQDQARVFEEFYQIGNPGRDRRKGLGLGLAIVKRLATLLGAALDLHSRVRRGTLFRLTVPRGDAAHVPAPSATPAPLRSEGLGGRTVLVIDDEAHIIEAMRTLLGGWGAQVVTAASFDESLVATLGLDRAPDLIIADYRLGAGPTGADAIQAVRERWGVTIPAIVVTGSTTPGHVHEAKARGFQLLAKPVAPAKLRALIAHELAAGSRHAMQASLPGTAAERTAPPAAPIADSG
jgi:signal transduction histidine kinase/DNA-binding NarL/FixJ family response regulator